MTPSQASPIRLSEAPYCMWIGSPVFCRCSKNTPFQGRNEPHQGRFTKNFHGISRLPAFRVPTPPPPKRLTERQNGTQIHRNIHTPLPTSPCLPSPGKQTVTRHVLKKPPVSRVVTTCRASPFSGPWMPLPRRIQSWPLAEGRSDVLDGEAVIELVGARMEPAG